MTPGDQIDDGVFTVLEAPTATVVAPSSLSKGRVVAVEPTEMDVGTLVEAAPRDVTWCTVTVASTSSSGE